MSTIVQLRKEYGVKSRKRHLKLKAKSINKKGGKSRKARKKSRKKKNEANKKNRKQKIGGNKLKPETKKNFKPFF